MENEEISKYLTEKMGLCWHDWKSMSPKYDGSSQCKKCGVMECMTISPQYSNINFFSPEGFFILKDWAIKQDWFKNLDCIWTDIGVPSAMDINYINPEAFAVAIYNYLKESE